MTKKTFWITGAASGLGLALTTAALKAGHSVFATDVRQEALEISATAQHWPRDRVLLSALDVRNTADWDNAEKLFLQRWSRLDVMINNAGILLSGPLSEVGDNDVHRMVDINVKGVMFGSQRAALPDERGFAVVTGQSLSARCRSYRGILLPAADESLRVSVFEQPFDTALDAQSGLFQAAKCSAG